MISRSGEQAGKATCIPVLHQPVIYSHDPYSPVTGMTGGWIASTGVVLGHQDCHRLRVGALTAAVLRYKNTALGGLGFELVFTFLECSSGRVVTGYFGAHALHAVSSPMRGTSPAVFFFRRASFCFKPTLW
jgi:hypothetical protein